MRIFLQMCGTNEDEIPDNGIDDDNNGFIDDVHGVNFANGDDTDNDPTGLPETPRSARHGNGRCGFGQCGDQQQRRGCRGSLERRRYAHQRGMRNRQCRQLYLLWLRKHPLCSHERGRHHQCELGWFGERKTEK